ncbi:uncharacterized protein KZ484_015324 [Pholidichthys leucotaenia]
MNSWEMLENGGNKWVIEDTRKAHPNEGISKNFVTSYRMCRKMQLNDLEKEGYKPLFMDEFQPAIRISNWQEESSQPTADLATVERTEILCFYRQEGNCPPQLDLASLFTEMQAEDLLNQDQYEGPIQLLLSEAAWLACMTHSSFFSFLQFEFCTF